MGPVITALIAAIPVLLPAILQLLVKTKADKITYFEKLKKAAIHDGKAVLAVAADSLLCLANEWEDEEWESLRAPLESFGGACAESARASAERAAKRSEAESKQAA